jgi:hypothetical protein
MPGRPIARRALVAALACAALAGCGGGDEGERPKGVDLTALRCPLVSTGVVDGIEEFAPAKDAFDTTELIGKPLQDAEAQAAEHGCKVLVSMEDERGLPVPTAIDPTQILVHTEEGAVSEIEGVGGGL